MHNRPSTPKALSPGVERQILGVKLAHVLFKALKPMHTEGVAFASRKSPRARCAKSNILAQVLNRGVVYLERRVASLAVCMSQLKNTCADFYAKDLTLNAGRQRLRCAWAINFTWR